MLGLAFLTLLAGFLARVLLIQGWAQPIRTATGSMAAALPGEHFLVTCADCGIRFPCGADLTDPDDPVVCPNCGYRHNEAADDSRRRGQRVRIDKWPLLRRAPRRFELFGFRGPEQRDRLSVKRIVGLPGETIAIQDGDLYANGKIVRKSMTQFRELAILVHDNAFMPRDDALPPRWVSRSTDNQTWFDFQPWKCFANPSPRETVTPLLDNYGYNQVVSRQLQQVHDILLTLELAAETPFAAVQLTDSETTFMVQMDFARQQLELQTAAGDVLDSAMLVRSPRYEIAVALCDASVLVEINGLALIDQAYEPHRGTPTLTPLAVRIDGLDSPPKGLKVYRDIHYLDPGGVGWPWKMAQPLGRDEFFLVGDNVPVSVDSRHWASPGLPRKLIAGKVLPCQ